MSEHVFFKWKDEYNTGITGIDEQHQMLAVYISDLYASISKSEMNEASRKIIAKLLEYTENHFWFEEQLMKSSGFPDYSNHVATHKKFIEQLSTFKSNSDKKLPITFQLVQFLKEWLKNHIMGDDKEYIPYVKRLPRQ
jgi:hemerythrin